MTPRKILLYGASNLWLSRRAALTELRQRFPGPLEIGLANGPGRSYGLRAGNPLIRYEALSGVDFGFGRGPGAKLALITDIGNDIAYSQKPEMILAWVRDLTTRLESENYEIIVGGIPAESLSRLNPLFFRALAKFYYPDGSVTKQKVTRDLAEVEIGVRDLCLERGYPHMELNPDWYGIDRFHLKMKARTAYWETLLQAYPVLTSYRTTWSLSARRPLFPRRYWFRGQEKTGPARYLDLVPNSITIVR
jgi:hypothetical protein